MNWSGIMLTPLPANIVVVITSIFVAQVAGVAPTHDYGTFKVSFRVGVLDSVGGWELYRDGMVKLSVQIVNNEPNGNDYIKQRAIAAAHLLLLEERT